MSKDLSTGNVMISVENRFEEAKSTHKGWIIRRNSESSVIIDKQQRLKILLWNALYNPKQENLTFVI